MLENKIFSASRKFISKTLGVRFWGESHSAELGVVTNIGRSDWFKWCSVTMKNVIYDKYYRDDQNLQR